MRFRNNLLVLLASLFISTQCFATHSVGGEIIYKHIVADSFEITLKAYRDCNGIGVPTPIIKVSSSCSTRNLIPTLISTKDITGIPNSCSVKSRCSGTYPYGFQEIIYKIGINLANDTSCCDYEISFSQCCRKSGTSTIPSSVPLYIEAKLNKCIKNTSPSFVLPPFFLAEVGKDFSTTFYAEDTIDKDFVTYELVDVLDTFKNSVSYTGSFSAKKPLSFQGFPTTTGSYPSGLSFDTSTGSFMCRPTSVNQISTIVVKATEWRKVDGILTKIGEITRESLLVTISSTSNRKPTFGNYKTQFYDGCPDSSSFCFDIDISDDDTNDTLVLDYIHTIKGITFTTSGTPNKPTVRVCYKPDSTIINNPRSQFFTIHASDEKCTLAGRISRTFKINYNFIPDSFDIDKNLTCSNLELKFKNYSKGITSATTSWEVKSYKNTYSKTDSIYNISLVDTGWHKIRMTVKASGYCDSTRVYVDSVYISPSNSFSIEILGKTNLCFEDSTKITSKLINGTAPFSYLWSNNTIADTTIAKLVLGKNIFSLTVTDNNKCKATDSITINYFNPKVTINADSVVCFGKQTLIKAVLKDTIKPSFKWDIGSANQDSILPTIINDSLFTFTLTDSSGCSLSQTHKIKMSNPLVSVNKDSSVCFNPTLTIKSNLAGSYAPYSYKWSSGDTTQNITKTMQTGSNKFILSVHDFYQCETKDSIEIKSFNPQVTLSGDTVQCINKTATLSASLNNTILPQYNWIGFPQNIASINPLISKQDTFYFHLLDSSGCVVNDTFIVEVSNPKVVINNDTDVCFNPSYTINSLAVNAQPPLKYQWSSGDTSPSITKNLNTGFNTFLLVLTDGYLCETRDSVTIKSFNPQVTLSGDTAVCFNDTATLLANYTNAVLPKFGWQNFPSNQLNISQKLNANQQFIFELVDSIGCTVKDSSIVKVSNPKINIISDTSFCESDSVLMRVDELAGYLPFTYSWEPFKLSGKQIALAPLSKDTINVIVSATDKIGCKTVDSLEIKIYFNPIITVITDTLCENQGKVSLDSFAQPIGGKWSGIAIANDSFDTKISGAGTFTVSYLFKDSISNCSSTKPATIRVDPPAKADFTVDSTKATINHSFNFTSLSTNALFHLWNFGDTNSGIKNLDTTINPTHKFSDTGVYTVKLVVASSLACPADSIIRTNFITVTKSTVSVRELNQNNLKLYPNPAKNKLTIEADNPLAEIVLVDVLGKRYRIENVSPSTKAEISIAHITAGIYIIEAKDIKGNIYTSKVQISR